MTLIPKIAAFYLGLWLVLWLLRRNPNSLLSRIAFSWHGPFPQVGERISAFRRRQASFAFGWLLQILVVAAALVLLAHFVEPLGNSETFQIVSAFALTIGAGMALLSAAYCLAASLKAKTLGPDPQFERIETELANSAEEESEA